MVRAKVVTVMRWYAQKEVNQEESEQKGDACLKERLVIRNEEDTDGRAKQGWQQMRSGFYTCID